jgi:hypothetical protein
VSGRREDKVPSVLIIRPGSRLTHEQVQLGQSLLIEVIQLRQSVSPMCLRPLFCLGFVLLAAAAVAGETAASGDARALVITMGLERSALLGMRLAIEDGAKTGKANPALQECAGKLDSSALVEVLAGELQAVLSSSEITSAQAFYASPAGQKSIDAGLQQLYQLAGRQPPGAVLTFTSAEARESDAFSKTAAGEKLIVRQVLGTPRVTNAIQNVIEKLLSACMENRQRSP